MLVYWALRLVQKRNQQRAHPWGLGLIGRISNRLWLIVQCAHFSFGYDHFSHFFSLPLKRGPGPRAVQCLGLGGE
jgi:hypothetical protein